MIRLRNLYVGEVLNQQIIYRRSDIASPVVRKLFLSCCDLVYRAAV